MGLCRWLAARAKRVTYFPVSPTSTPGQELPPLGMNKLELWGSFWGSALGEIGGCVGLCGMMLWKKCFLVMFVFLGLLIVVSGLDL